MESNTPVQSNEAGSIGNTETTIMFLVAKVKQLEQQIKEHEQLLVEYACRTIDTCEVKDCARTRGHEGVHLYWKTIQGKKN